MDRLEWREGEKEQDDEDGGVRERERMGVSRISLGYWMSVTKKSFIRNKHLRPAPWSSPPSLITTTDLDDVREVDAFSELFFVEGGKHRHVPKHLNERKKRLGVNFDVLITMAGAKK